MRALALAALLAAGCLDFSSLGDRFQGDAGAVDLAGTDALPACPAAAGPITFVDSSSVIQGQPLTDTLTLPRPPATQACDVLVLMLFADLDSQIVDPPDWNKFLALPSAQHFATRYYWRVATADEPTSYSLQMSPAQFAAANLVAYRGADPTMAIEGSLTSTCNAPPINVAGFTPHHADAQILMMCTCDTGFGLNPQFVDPSGMLLRSLTLATAVWDAPQASGAIPSRTVSCQTSSELCCVELALHSTP
jgi:hypothetical protein